MKICPKCHTRYDDSQNFCIKCGTKLIPEENETKVESPIEKTEKVSSDRDTDISKFKFERKNRKPFTAVIVAAAVAVLCVVGFIVHANMTESSANNDQPDPPVVSVSSTTRTDDVGGTDNTAEETYMTTSEEEPVIYNTSTSPDDSDDYIIPGSDSRYITEDEISGLNADQLKLARNEIFARHGRKFDSEYLQNYFNSKDWYTPSIEPDDFDYDTLLNSYEKANIDIIKKAESKFSSGSDVQTTDNGEQTFLESIQGRWYSGGHDMDGSNRFVADIEDKQIVFTYSDGGQGTDDISNIGQDSDGYYIVTSWGNCYQLSEGGDTLYLFFDADYPNKDNYSGTDSLYRSSE